jgi:outer membrane protein assembly factor BamD
MKRIILVLSLLLAVGSGCSQFSKALKEPRWDKRLESATQYYNKGDYYRAALLLEDIVPIVKGGAQAEEILLKYAYCQFYQKQYLLASFHFKNFYDTYRRSEKAQEACYMHAFSLYQASPEPHLDQESTSDAIEALQNYISSYPDTDYAKQATSLIDALRKKLEQKAFENAKLYYKLESYQAAVINLNLFERDFPDSKFQEEAAFLKIQAQYDYARKSAFSKQRERYWQVVTFYQKFIDKYPNSAYLKAAEALFSAADKALRQNFDVAASR